MASHDLSNIAGTGFSRLASLGQSFPDPGPIAEESIARDLENASDDDESALDSSGDEREASTVWSNTSANMSYVGSYRRPSFTLAGTRGALLTHKRSHADKLSRRERETALAEERSLLRDNNIIPPKHPQVAEEGDSDTASHMSRHLRIPPHTNGTHKRPSVDEEAVPAPPTNGGDPSENDPLLGDPQLPYGGLDEATINTKWEAAVAAGLIQTTWQREAKVLAGYSAPLMVTFLLQYSLTVASIFTLGHVGPSELGAVSIASMTANITGYAVYQGLHSHMLRPFAMLISLCRVGNEPGYIVCSGVWIREKETRWPPNAENDIFSVVAHYSYRNHVGFSGQDLDKNIARAGGGQASWSLPQSCSSRRPCLCLLRGRKAICASPGSLLCSALCTPYLRSAECILELVLCLGASPRGLVLEVPIG